MILLANAFIFFNVNAFPIQCFSIDLIEWMMDMTLNFIWWWGYCPSTLEKVEYPFIAITFRTTLGQSGSTF